jgi:hypothetical protein
VGKEGKEWEEEEEGVSYEEGVGWWKELTRVWGDEEWE